MNNTSYSNNTLFIMKSCSFDYTRTKRSKEKKMNTEMQKPLFKNSECRYSAIQKVPLKLHVVVETKIRGNLSNN